MPEETKIAAEVDILKELELGLGETTDPEQLISPGAELSTQPVEEPAAETPPVAEEPVVVEPEPEPVKEPVKEPEAVVEPEPVAAEPTTTEGDVDYKKRVELLEGELGRVCDQLAQRGVAPGPEAPVAEERKEPVAPAPVAAPAPTPADVYPFVTDENYEQIVASPKAMNQAMNSVYNRGVEANMRAMPGLVNKLIAQAFYVQTVRDKFYADNKDLTRHARYVGHVENEVRAANPDLPLDKLFIKIAEEVRGQLGLEARKPKTPAPVTLQPNPTAVTKPPSSRRPVAQISGLEQDIADLKDVHY